MPFSYLVIFFFSYLSKSTVACAGTRSRVSSVWVSRNTQAEPSAQNLEPAAQHLSCPAHRLQGFVVWAGGELGFSCFHKSVSRDGLLVWPKEAGCLMDSSKITVVKMTRWPCCAPSGWSFPAVYTPPCFLGDPRMSQVCAAPNAALFGFPTPSQ